MAHAACLSGVQSKHNTAICGKAAVRLFSLGRSLVYCSFVLRNEVLIVFQVSSVWSGVHVPVWSVVKIVICKCGRVIPGC